MIDTSCLPGAAWAPTSPRFIGALLGAFGGFHSRQPLPEKPMILSVQSERVVSLAGPPGVDEIMFVAPYLSVALVIVTVIIGIFGWLSHEDNG